MKITIAIARIIVGILFILSGLVKAIDPLGLSYKMQEFFEVWNSDLAASHFFLKTPLISLFSWLHEYSLALAIIMITFEIMAGLALLIGWRPKLITNLLLLLIIFFTFLTGYAYASGKFKNCGCFGDCLPITPFTSFAKDIVLLLLILLLVFGKRYITPIATNSIRNMLLTIGLLVTLGLQWYVLNYMPLVDCLPFKKGKNISEQMKIPAGAVPDSFAIRFVYEKGGKQYEFSPSELPADLKTYTFVNRTDKLIRKGNAEPPIKGFSLTTLDDVDSTQQILSYPGYSVLYFVNMEEGNELPRKEQVQPFLQTAVQKNMPVYAVTNTGKKLQQQFTQLGWHYPILTCDGTVFRTAARTNPCLYLLHGGTIVNKWSGHQIDAALQQLSVLSTQQPATTPLFDNDSTVRQ